MSKPTSLPGKAGQFTACVMTIGFFALAYELRYLWPYLGDILGRYSTVIYVAIGLVAVNIFTGSLILARWWTRAAPGHILTHIDEPLRGGFSRRVVR